MLWKDMNRYDRAELIRSVWDKDCSAATVAEMVSQQTGSTVSRHAIIGTYNRNVKLQQSHPLGGGGLDAKRQRRDENGKAIPKHPRRPQPKKDPKLSQRRIRTDGEPFSSERKTRVRAEYRAFDKATRHILLEQVGLNQCHWSVNDPDPGEKHLFCGLETPDGQRYCTHHKGRSVR